MKASKKRIYSILATIFLLIGAALIYSYLIKPTYAQIDVLRGQIITKSQLIDEYENYLTKIQSLLNEYQGVSKNFQDLISLALPNEPNVPQAINQINGLASISGLKIEQLDIRQSFLKPTANSSAIKSVGTLEMNVKFGGGNYSSIRSFFQRLETNSSLINLIDLKMQSEDNGNNLSFDATVDSYYQGN